MHACPSGKSEELANLLGQCVVRRAGENLPLIVLAHSHRLFFAQRFLVGCRMSLLVRLRTIARRRRWSELRWFSPLLPSNQIPRFTWLSCTPGFEVPLSALSLQLCKY